MAYLWEPSAYDYFICGKYLTFIEKNFTVFIMFEYFMHEIALE